MLGVGTLRLCQSPVSQRSSHALWHPCFSPAAAPTRLLSLTFCFCLFVFFSFSFLLCLLLGVFKGKLVPVSSFIYFSSLIFVSVHPWIFIPFSGLLQSKPVLSRVSQLVPVLATGACSGWRMLGLAHARVGTCSGYLPRSPRTFHFLFSPPS